VNNVSGMKVLITGAAMGMGRLYADLSVREGAAVTILWDINTEALEAARAELAASGAQVMAMRVDVSDAAAVRAASEAVLQQHGRIDVLINNAGIVRGKLFWEHSDIDISLTMAINALAPMYIARAFLPAMIEGRSPARVVNIASAAGLVSNPRMSVYCGSKWAATGWSDSVRLELEQCGHDHVRVTTVCPTYISTGMFEGARGPLMTPIMTPQYVVDRVWAGMKAGKPLLTMPWTVRLSMLVKGVLPLRMWDFVAGRIFGIYSSMKDFRGH